MPFDIYSMKRRVNILPCNTELTYRTGAVESHIMCSTRWQNKTHSTGDYAYKCSIYYTLSIWPMWTFRQHGIQYECMCNCGSSSVEVMWYKVGCCVGWNAWNKSWPHLWMVECFGVSAAHFFHPIWAAKWISGHLAFGVDAKQDQMAPHTVVCYSSE